MTNETKHTPTPWKVGAKHVIGFVSIDDDQSFGMTIPFIDVYGTDPEANAAHIVKCVNMHDELVEALDAIQNLTRGKIALDGKVSSCARLNMAIDLAADTLKKAGAL